MIWPFKAQYDTILRDVIHGGIRARERAYADQSFTVVRRDLLFDPTTVPEGQPVIFITPTESS